MSDESGYEIRVGVNAANQTVAIVCVEGEEQLFGVELTPIQAFEIVNGIVEACNKIAMSKRDGSSD